MVASLRSERTWLDFHNCAREISLVQTVLSGCHAMPRIQYQPMVFLCGNIRRTFNLTADLHLVPGRERVEVYIYSTTINYDIYFIVTLRKFGLHHFKLVIMEGFPFDSTVISPLKPHSETLCTASFILVQNINTASQRVCVFHVIFRTERKYFPIQQ